MKNLPVILLIIMLSSCSFMKSVFSPPVKPEEGFKVALASAKVQVGEMEMQFDSQIPFAKVRKILAKVHYYPVEDAVCLEYKLDTITYYHFFNNIGRKAFVEALANYNADFESQQLINSSSKTKNKYGSSTGFLIWQEFKFAIQANSNVEVWLGYEFKQKAPFFTVRRGEAYYKNVDSEKDKKISEKTFYLTRTQAAELADLFDQDYLISTIPETLMHLVPIGSDRKLTPVEYDAY